jgi:MFS family permease
MSNWFSKYLPFGSFNKNTKLFLTATIIDGVIYSTLQLFYNFFILSRGFDREFLGVMNSIPSFAALFLGIPMGMLSDKLGRRKAMLTGLFFQVCGMTLTLLAHSKWLLILGSIIYGSGNNLYVLSHAPFMMAMTNRDNRGLLFSLNSGLSTLSGAAGSLFAGQLPAVVAPLIHAEVGSTAVYQTILLSAVFLGAFSLLPIFLIKEPDRIEAPKTRSENLHQLVGIIKHVLTWKLLAPNLIIGFGAAILIPYMNLFFAYTFSMPENEIGVLFSLSSLLMGAGIIVGPIIERKIHGKIKTVVLTQASSLIFLIFLGFVPIKWVAQVSYLARGVLMNIATPFYSAFAMEMTAPESQGTFNSMLNISWTLGWAVGPLISGMVQDVAGFRPLFITTTILYSLGCFITWKFFHNSEENISGKEKVYEVEQSLS